MLSEFSIFDTNNNKLLNHYLKGAVVNCFQNSVSLIPTTTTIYRYKSHYSLWIAFRIQYLWYQQQQNPCRHGAYSGCELLSEFSIFDTNNNAKYLVRYAGKLWIAFRIQYLWYQQQLFNLFLSRYPCCELLSEFSIFDTNNNELLNHYLDGSVVNCFQNSVSLIPTTTSRRPSLHWNSCELLSEFSIFDTNNNHNFVKKLQEQVVNCFQNSVSLIPTTTDWLNIQDVNRLWIAFRIQYLWYQQQPPNSGNTLCFSCELLSEFSIFDTNNNVALMFVNVLLVVNCFQNSVSLIPTTTNYSRLNSEFRCELLSEFSIFDTNNNRSASKMFRQWVVNCFQNSVSLIPTTTTSQSLPKRFSCELLSEFSIFDTNNNLLV